MNTELAMLAVVVITAIIMFIFFVLCKKKNYDGKVTVYIDEDHDYKASISFDGLMNAIQKGEGLFQVEAIYLEGD